MSLVITMNLLAIAIVGGGVAAAMWIFYKSLGDPYERPRARKTGKVQVLDARSRQPEPVLTDRPAA